MRKLVYVLSNGTVVDTKKKADESGLAYSTDLRPIAESPTALTPKQEAMRKKAIIKK